MWKASCRGVGRVVTIVCILRPYVKRPIYRDSAINRTTSNNGATRQYLVGGADRVSGRSNQSTQFRVRGAGVERLAGLSTSPLTLSTILYLKTIDLKSWFFLCCELHRPVTPTRVVHNERRKYCQWRPEKTSGYVLQYHAQVCCKTIVGMSAVWRIPTYAMPFEVELL